MKGRVLQRVVERFVYEGLLLHNQWSGRRWRVTLAEVLQAGEAEPRLLELLPGVLLYRPRVIYRWERDIARYPALQVVLKQFDVFPPTAQWQGLPIGDLRKAAGRVAELRRVRQRTRRWRNLNLRVAEEDLRRLEMLAVQSHQPKSAVIRALIARAVRSEV